MSAAIKTKKETNKIYFNLTLYLDSCLSSNTNKLKYITYRDIQTNKRRKQTNKQKKINKQKRKQTERIRGTTNSKQEIKQTNNKKRQRED